MRTWELSPKLKIERLNLKIDKSHHPQDCWIWKGFITPTGYGRYKWMQHNWLAHRLVWHLYVEELLDSSIKLCHTCDNRLCVNPVHLWKGTQQENISDCVTKGRNNHGLKYGTDNINARLNPDKVKQIRSLFDNGLSVSELGRRFNIARKAIYCVIKHETWKHVN